MKGGLRVESIKENIKKIDNKIIIIVTIISSFLLLFYQRNIINNILIEHKTKIIIIIISQGVLYLFAYILFLKRSISIHKCFAVIALVLGLVFMTIVPIYQVADEVVHSYRAYGVANGEFIYKNIENSLTLPKSIKTFYDATEVERIAFKNNEKINKEEYKKAINIPLNKQETEKYDAGATSAYTFIAYIPQAIGLAIGNMLNLPIYFVLLLGRLTNFLVWIILCASALKIVPYKKELFMFIMLLPMSLNQGMSMSPDAILNSSSFLLIAYILNLKYVKNKMNIKDFIILLILVSAIVSVKMPYMIICGLILIIPSSKIFNNFELGKFSFIKNIIVLLIIFSVGLGIFIGWGKITNKNIVSNIEISIEEENIEEDSDSGLGETIKYILNNPKEFLQKCVVTLKSQGVHYKNSFIGNFGWLDGTIPYKLMTLIICVGIVLILNGEKHFTLKVWDRFVMISIGLALMFTLFAVSLQWYGMSFEFFPGIQGRYFYPFILCLILPFTQNKLIYRMEKYSALVMLFNVFSLIVSINVLYLRYWI